jgi:ubiquinone biosynthesis protein
MLTLIADLVRLARAGFIMTREGVLASIPTAELPPLAAFGVRLMRIMEKRGVAETTRANRLATAFTMCGPNWVKLGQFLATRADVVGPSIAADLSALLDRVPPFPQAQAEAAIKTELGKTVSELFETFGPPIAAASIAQVHKATIVDSEGRRTVAVKVLRPGIRSRFMVDLRSYKTGAALMERFVPSLRRLKPVGVVDTLAASVALEMDLRLEAAACAELAQNTKDDEGFRVPKVEWEFTTRGILVTEWIDGTPLSDIAAVKAAGHDLEALGVNIIRHFLRHAMRDGFFHADMHQGNLIIAPDGTLVAIDFGIMGRLSTRERRFLAEILWSFITRNYRRGSEVHFEAGYVPRTQSVEIFAQALRAIGEPIHQKTAADISMSRVLTQLLEYTELFDMQTRLELVFLQKTMVVVEGVGRTLNPQLDMWKTSEPVVKEWLQRNLGPRGGIETIASVAERSMRLLADAPALLARAEAVASDLANASETGMRLAPESVRAIGEAEARRARGQTTALWVIAIALSLIAMGLLR